MSLAHKETHVESHLVGKWQLNYDGCIETYEYQENGIMVAKSKDEIINRKYHTTTIDAYTLYVEMEPVKTNGLESCTGKVSSLDDLNHLKIFVNFQKDYNSHYVSFNPSDYKSNNLGSFVRVD